MLSMMCSGCNRSFILPEWMIDDVQTGKMPVDAVMCSSCISNRIAELQHKKERVYDYNLERADTHTK